MAKDAETAAIRGLEPGLKVRQKHDPKDNNWTTPAMKAKARKLRQRDEEEAEEEIKLYVYR